MSGRFLLPGTQLVLFHQINFSRPDIRVRFRRQRPWIPPPHVI